MVFPTVRFQRMNAKLIGLMLIRIAYLQEFFELNFLDGKCCYKVCRMLIFRWLWQLSFLVSYRLSANRGSVLIFLPGMRFITKLHLMPFAVLHILFYLDLAFLNVIYHENLPSVIWFNMVLILGMEEIGAMDSHLERIRSSHQYVMSTI